MPPTPSPLHTLVDKAALQHGINEQVRQVFLNARHFDSGFPKIYEWAKKRGWFIAYANHQWVTQSVKTETKGINGPRFDSFGELLEWLMADEE